MAEIQSFYVVDDDHLPHTNYGRGYLPRDYQSFPIGSLKCGPKLDLPLIDPAEFKDRIAEKTAKKLWMSDQSDRAGLKVKDQAQTNLCWANAPTHGMEIINVMQGEKAREFSAASVAGPINGWRNQGGSGIEALKGLFEAGACTVELLGNTDISRRDYADAAMQNALLHRVTGFHDLDPSDDDVIRSCILSDFPVTVGIPDWGHEVLLTFLVIDQGQILYGFDNSWGMDWGTNGRGVLTGRRAVFDEAGAIHTVTASVA